VGRKVVNVEGPMDMDKMRRMESSARDIAKLLERALDGFRESNGNKMGFALMLFSFDGPEFTWISNAQRDDMIKALREFIAKYESGEATQTYQQRN
jgi:hypothetical protein